MKDCVPLSSESGRLSPWFSRHPAIQVFALAFLLLSGGTAGLEITRIDVRFALMTQEMAQYGIGVFPTVNAVEYVDYPSAYVFLSYLTTLGARFLNCWTLALPSILCGAYLIAMTLLIGERREKGLGETAAILLLLTLEFLTLCGGFAIDLPVAAAGVTLLYILEKSDGKHPLAEALFFAVLLGASFAVRGPLGIILPGALAGGYLLAARQWKRLIFWVFGGAAALVVSLFCWWKLIHAQGGEALWQAFLGWQVSSRLKDGNPIYYFTNGLFSYAPTGIAAILAVVTLRKKCLSGFLVRYLTAAALVLFLLSIPGCKHLRYMALALPMLALPGAYGLRHSPEVWESAPVQWIFSRLAQWSPWLMLAGLFGLGAAGFLLMPHDFLPWGHWAAAAILLTAAGIFFPRNQRGWRIAISGAVFMTLGWNSFLASSENSESFVRQAESLRAGAPLYYYNLGPDHDDLKYQFHLKPEQRKHTVYLYRENFPCDPQMDRMYPRFTASEKLGGLPPNAFFLLPEKELDSLREETAAAGRSAEVVAKGKLGHKKCIAAVVRGQKEK